MADSTPHVSIVIPSFNGMEHLEECLASLDRLDYPADRVEVLVVDNASTDGSTRFVRKRFPSTRVLELMENRGFAAACNRGAHDAHGSVVVFLNNDMRVDPAWLRELVTPLVASADVAATSSRILSWDGKAIDFVGGAVNFYGHGFQPLHGRPVGEDDSTTIKPLLFACGGSMAARRDIFLSSGGFDEDYFAFFEDIDLGWRLWVLGYRVLYAPAAVAYHKGHATGSKLPAHQLRVLYERNALATLIKNYDDANLARVLPAAMLLAGKRALVYGHVQDGAFRPWAKDGEETQSVKRVGLSHVVALADLADGADVVWGKRAIVQAARRRSDREILRLLDSPFETNCLDEEYMLTQHHVQAVFGIDQIFAEAKGPSRILIISNDIVDARMAGPGIRAWEMAKVLSSQNEVTLAVPNDHPLAAEGFKVQTYRSKIGTGLREMAEAHDVLVVQGFVLHLFPYLTQLGKRLVVDLYDPFTLENLHVFSHDLMEERTSVHQSHLEVLNAQIRAGDFFLCASEKQRDYWIGMMAANNRINPHQYDSDPTLRDLIDVVSFGMPTEPPTAAKRVLKGVHPGIGERDKVILWGGGIWEWFDPLTLIEAVDRIRKSRPEVKLFFMGVKHPNPLVPAMEMTAKAIELAKELGLEGTAIFFNEWVPYEERASYLLEADVGVSLHFDHLETRYSYRTRVLDYIWAGLPVVCTGGDAVGEVVAANGLGRVVDYRDVDGLVGALLSVLDEPRESYADRFAAVAKDLTWDRVLQPLLKYCDDPHPAADRMAAATSSINLGAAGIAARPRGLNPWPLSPLRRPPTPLWRLPSRALVYLQMGGLPRLWQEAKSYVRWVRIRGLRAGG